MRRLTTTLITSLALMALFAPVALAQNSGEGLYGETNDKVITNAGFILIAAFPTLIMIMSLLQWRGDRRKDAKKKAAKQNGGDDRWRGGW
jgi:hypothetical protein